MTIDSRRANVRRITRRLTATALSVGAAAVLAACGSSSDGGGSASTGGGSGGGGGDMAAVKAAAQKKIDAGTAPVKFLAPGPAFDISKAKGKEIWIVCNDTSLPFVQQVVKGFNEAAGVAGTKARLFNAKGETSTAARGIQQAVAAKASAIVVFGITFKYVQQAVSDAKAAGIPVVGALNVDVKADLEKDAAGEVSIDYGKSGELIAAYAIANTEQPANAVYQNLPGIDTFAAMKAGVERGFAECPECKLKTVDFTGDFKTAEATQTPSTLARDPKVNWIIPAIDGMAQFAVPAIKAAGKGDKVQVGSINAVAGNLALIQKGDVQTVDVGNNNQWFGWAMVDRTLRAINGEQPAISEVPVKALVKENLDGKDVADEDAVFDDVDYRGEYRKLWK
ncbi:sugar ABC transporter substrate-binding protein [Patulibacter defluvii]|uniref:sugar ABC transporter substrate-binding protein n=1 Tax=Patulibacter defluvii TaxID=3095358 RepID=UPI002A7564CF|nr:sugar ABC transporter substrate-binding protein [Patulibacter sp. DM4]